MIKKNREEALKSLVFYRGPAAANEAIKALEKERDEAAHQEKLSFVQVFTRKTFRSRLFMTFMLMFAVQFTGTGPVMSYSEPIFVGAGLDEQSAQLAGLGIGLFNIAFPFAVVILIEKLGRRAMYLGGIAVSVFCLFMLTIFIQFGAQFNMYGLLLASIPFLYLYQAGYSMASSVSWVMPSEMFASNARAYAVALQVFSYWFNQGVTLLCYLPFKDAVGVPISMVPFIVIGAISFIFFYIYLPETKGKSAETFVGKRSRKTKPVKTISKEFENGHMANGSNDSIVSHDSKEHILENGNGPARF